MVTINRYDLKFKFIIIYYKHIFFLLLDLSGPYLHINDPLSLGTNFMDEFSIASNESKHHSNSKSINKNISVSLVL